MGEYYLVLDSLNNFKETYPTKSQQEENKTYKIFLKRGKKHDFSDSSVNQRKYKKLQLHDRKKILQIESNEAENYKKGPKWCSFEGSYITSDILSLSADASE